MSPWKHMHEVPPAKIVALGYLSYILIGWLVLCLPFAHQAGHVAALDNLFTATSAVSTTGLVTVSVADSYSFFGELVVMLLIQLGGIGYMTFGSFVILSQRDTLSGVRANIGNTVFSLPASFRIDKFIHSVIVFTVIIESVGAALFYVLLRQAGETSPLWSAVFHSVSAFCTAGFGLHNDSFVSYAGNFWINLLVTALSYLGAIGFIVCLDVWHMVTGKVRQITLTSKIILWATFWLSAIATLLIFVIEPSITKMPVGERLVASWFQAMTAMTTVGFNTIDTGTLSHATLVIVVMLMVIGASPSGTGGGIKSTTLTAILGVMRSALRGKNEVRFWGRPVPIERVWTAIASLGFYLSVLMLGTFMLELTEAAPFETIVFEAASALGTVGLSTGLTASLTSVGKLLVIALMYCGRLGPLTFGMALFVNPRRVPATEDNDLAV